MENTDYIGVRELKTKKKLKALEGSLNTILTSCL